MSGQLQLAGDGGPARCSGCGALAVGPCARCDTPLCGDCCEIVQGGVKPYAVCRACNGRTGASLGGRWRVVLWWIAAPILGLAALLVLLHWLAG